MLKIANFDDSYGDGDNGDDSASSGVMMVIRMELAMVRSSWWGWCWGWGWGGDNGGGDGDDRGGMMVGMVAVMMPLQAPYILRDISQLIYTYCNYVSNYYESHVMEVRDALMNKLHKVLKCVYKREENYFC